MSEYDIVGILEGMAAGKDYGPATLQEVARQALDLIERLRSIAGKADVGESFAEVAKDLRHEASTA